MILACSDESCNRQLHKHLIQKESDNYLGQKNPPRYYLYYRNIIEIIAVLLQLSGYLSTFSVNFNLTLFVVCFVFFFSNE